MKMRRWISMLLIVLLSVALFFFNIGHVMALEVGDKAPDFKLPSTTGEKISLSQFRGKKPVVLYFYLFALEEREQTMQSPLNRTIPSSRRPTPRYWV